MKYALNVKPKKIPVTVFMIAMVLLIFASLVYAPFQKTDALSGSQFNAGRIIDDSIFYNRGAMTSGQIQNFLNSKVPTCDTNGTKMYNSTQTRAQWAAANGKPQPPYICLKSYTANTSNIPPESGLCDGYSGKSGETAAQIIHKVAHSCRINPQVLLVMLQKEQSLITDDWPWPVQYEKAMGAFCPDTAPCDPGYSGFFKQVYYGAHRLKVYAANPNSFNYKAGRDNSILYHPNTACGRSNVFIQNQATASLYIYTPYRPNKAALENLYGTGDGCSSYGNRNFWRLFNDWFGSTIGTRNYNWKILSQKAYTDSTMSTEFSNHTPNLKFGERAYMVIRVQNISNQVWWDNSVRLATDKPQGHNSKFCEDSWITCNRATTFDEDSVAPNEVATFKFWIKAPRQAGSYKAYFTPLIEGVSWFPSLGMYYPINVTPPELDGTVEKYRIYTNGSRTTSIRESEIKNGHKYLISYKIKNTGLQTWTKGGSNPTRLGIAENQNSPLCDDSWISCNRPAGLQENQVAPGEIGTFEFWITTPYQVNGHTVLTRYRLLKENLSWVDYPRLNSWYVYNTPVTTWSLVDQSSYTDATKTTITPTNDLARGERVYAVVKARNLSGKSWKKGGAHPMRIGVLKNRTSLACDSTWIACTRPAGMIESEVAPGGVGTFEFWLKAPSDKSINVAEFFTILAENNYWLGNTGLYYHVRAE